MADYDDGAGYDGAGYDDGKVACGDQELVIRHYYFPAGAKHIPYQEITEVRQVPLSPMGRWRIHGSGDLNHWFGFDARRPRKHTAFVVHTASWIRPVCTPADPARAAAVLQGHGVKVTAGPERGLF